MAKRQEVRIKEITLEYTYRCSACDATATERQTFFTLADPVQRPCAPPGWLSFDTILFCNKHRVRFDVRPKPRERAPKKALP